jgi:hypothetical protein
VQGQPGAEDRLDDLVLQVSGDPVAVLQEAELTQALLQPRGLLL